MHFYQNMFYIVEEITKNIWIISYTAIKEKPYLTLTFVLMNLIKKLRKEY